MGWWLYNRDRLFFLVNYYNFCTIGNVNEYSIIIFNLLYRVDDFITIVDCFVLLLLILGLCGDIVKVKLNILFLICRIFIPVSKNIKTKNWSRNARVTVEHKVACFFLAYSLLWVIIIYREILCNSQDVLYGSI